MYKTIRHNLVFATIIASIVLGMMQCKKKQNEKETTPLVDTCSGKSPVNASFRVLQDLGDGDLVEDDTVACFPSISDSTKKNKSCRNCILEANEANASFYKWQIGNNTSSQRDFELSFNKAFGVVRAKLSIDKMPNHACFPTDDGKDSVEQVFVVKEYDKHPLIGTYIGSFEDTPNDTLNVEIKPYPFECFRSWVQRGMPASEKEYPKNFDAVCSNSHDGGLVLSIWGLVPNYWLPVSRFTSFALSLNNVSIFLSGFGYEEACFVGKQSIGKLKDGILTIDFDYCNNCTSDCSSTFTTGIGLVYKDGAWKRRKAILRKIN